MYMQKRRLDAASKYRTGINFSSKGADSSLQTSTSLSIVSEPETSGTGSTSFSNHSSPCEDLLPMAVMPNVKQVAPAADLPLREPLVQRAPFEKDFVPLEDIPSYHEQSASIKSKQFMQDNHLGPLYPHFMEKVGEVASTLNYMTIKEKEQREARSCCKNAWTGLKNFLSSERELQRQTEEEPDSKALLFWHRGQRSASHVPRSNTDYVIATFSDTKKKQVRRNSIADVSLTLQEYNESVS